MCKIFVAFGSRDQAFVVSWAHPHCTPPRNAAVEPSPTIGRGGAAPAADMASHHEGRSSESQSNDHDVLPRAVLERICRDAAPLVLTLLHATFNAPRSWLRAVLEDLDFIPTSSFKCRELCGLTLLGWFRHFREHGKRAVEVFRAAIAEPSCNCVGNLSLPHHSTCEEE